MIDQTKETAHVLWTSGWDSTFRVIDAALSEERIVQPWYVIDPDRRSRRIEIKTMDEIRGHFAKRSPAAAARILPTCYRHKRDIPASTRVSSAFRALPGPGKWGPQYEWLARLAEAENVRFEIGLKADDGPIRRLSQYLIATPDNGYILNPPTGLPAHIIFSRFNLPLVHLSKLDMESIAEQRGFADILEMTWFCQHPTLRGSACGMCIPCQHYREEGLGRRLPSPPGWRDRVEFHVVNKAWGVFTRARAFAKRSIQSKRSPSQSDSAL